VRVVEASAFMGISPALAAWRISGLVEEDGRIVARHGVIAKISRPEVAEPFLRPAPPKLVEELLAAGKVTARQAELARRVPMADDLTVEADSGGHTDRRPLVVMLPVILRLRARIEAELALGWRVGVGAAGGIGDPWSAAAAFAMGADHVVTGSVNQACLEAGTSAGVKAMLAEVGPADVTSCPAPDMFELGAEVQVLARGSLYPQRARQLRELYRSHGALEELPVAERERLEKQVFQQPLGEVWASTRRFWEERDPREVERAERDPRHRMALVFRSYLGLSSRWARAGEASRKRDFQVWCGPAMGLFNDWTRGSALAGAESRGVVRVNEALLRAARVATRVRVAAALDAALPAAAWDVRVPG
jgi:PfaD family protein